MKFNFPLARILNRKGSVGSGLRHLSKIGTLANVRAGHSVLSSTAKAHGVVWLKQAPTSLAPENFPGHVTSTSQGASGSERAFPLLTVEDLTFHNFRI